MKILFILIIEFFGTILNFMSKVKLFHPNPNPVEYFRRTMGESRVLKKKKKKKS